jgi:hypothetical protein
VVLTKFKDWPRWLQIAHGLLFFVMAYLVWPKTNKQYVWCGVLFVYSMVVYFVFIR